MSEDVSVRRDAERWRYTQRKGYFSCGPYSQYGDFMGYSVGVQAPGATVNESVRGRGDTLNEAIDKALVAEGTFRKLDVIVVRS